MTTYDFLEFRPEILSTVKPTTISFLVNFSWNMILSNIWSDLNLTEVYFCRYSTRIGNNSDQIGIPVAYINIGDTYSSLKRLQH